MMDKVKEIYLCISIYLPICINADTTENSMGMDPDIALSVSVYVSVYPYLQRQADKYTY